MGKQGKAQTVLGPIDPFQLGLTLIHEHCLIDQRMWLQSPTSAAESELSRAPMSSDLQWYVRYHPYSNRDNLHMIDEATAITELSLFRQQGGKSVVDVTPWGCGRDPRALKRISIATGLNILMGTGPYVRESLPDDFEVAHGRISEMMIQDIEVGVEGTGVCAGIIGEIGVQWPLTRIEHEYLNAAATTQRETGAAVSIHPGFSPDCPFEVLEVLDAHGADLTRVVMSHVDGRIFDDELLVQLARSSCYMAFDMFGFEGWHSARTVKSETHQEQAHMPCDAERVDLIKKLIEEGFVRQLLISHDIDAKYRLRRYGGGGYTHILSNVVPLMRRKGIREHEIQEILVKNASQLLQFA